MKRHSPEKSRKSPPRYSQPSRCGRSYDLPEPVADALELRVDLDSTTVPRLRVAFEHRAGAHGVLP